MVRAKTGPPMALITYCIHNTIHFAFSHALTAALALPSRLRTECSIKEKPSAGVTSDAEVLAKYAALATRADTTRARGEGSGK
jgi:hypothetical protein